MRKWRTKISVMLIFALLATSIVGNVEYVSAETSPQIYAENISAKPGSEVSIPVNISGNPGIMQRKKWKEILNILFYNTRKK